ncbi:MAG: MFS transporter [Eubacteriales bacterium]
MESNAYSTEPSKLWNKSYIFILMISALNAFAFFMIATILSKYLVGIGTTITLAGIIVGLFSITSLFSRPLCGLMADSLNNVKLLKWSNVFLAIGFLGFAFTKNIPLLIIFRILNGIGFAIGGTAQVALATKYIPQNKMGEGIGYMGLGMVLSSAVAPGVGLMIADGFGMGTTFIASSILTVVAFFFLSFFKEEQKETKRLDLKKITFSDIIAPKALPYTFVASTFSFINGIIASYIVLFADEKGIVGISSYFTLYAVVLLVIRPISGKIMDKKGIRVTVLPGLLLTAVSMFFLGRSSALTAILVTGIFRAIGQGAAQPSLQAGCINKVGRSKSGVATSTYYLGGDIGQGIGPMIGGVILAQIAGVAGYRMLFDLCGVLMLIALVFFYMVTRKEKKTDEKTATT